MKVFVCQYKGEGFHIQITKTLQPSHSGGIQKTFDSCICFIMYHQGMKENYFYGFFIKGDNFKPPSYAEIWHIKLQIIFIMCKKRMVSNTLLKLK